MPRKSKPKQLAWEVIKLKASPALFVGVVYAEDEESAYAQAVIELKLDPTKHYMVRRPTK